MGMFMASVAFRKPDSGVWQDVKPRLQQFLSTQDGLINELDSGEQGCAILSPYGDAGQILAELAPQISQLIGGIVVFATCCDSDFDLLEVYDKGSLAEKCYIGEVFEEYLEFGDYSQPNLEFWQKLLVDQNRMEELREALFGEEVFAEDHLRKLSELTELPIFKDALFLED